MSFRFGRSALGFGAALGLATAVALGVGAFEEAAVIVVRPVELVDPAPDDPFDLDPLFAPGPGPGRGAAPAPESLDEHARTDAPLETRSVALAGGDVVTLRFPDGLPLRLADEDIAFVELAESALGEDGTFAPEAASEADPDPDELAVPGNAGTRFAVYAVLSESGRAAWLPFAARHANDYLLVELAGRPVDLVRPLGWSRGLRIGVFADELDRARYLDALELEPHSTRMEERAPD